MRKPEYRYYVEVKIFCECGCDLGYLQTIHININLLRDPNACDSFLNKCEEPIRRKLTAECARRKLQLEREKNG